MHISRFNSMPSEIKEVHVRKRCYECGYIELVEVIDRKLILALDLTVQENLTCAHCRKKAIRLDIDVVGVEE